MGNACSAAKPAKTEAPQNDAPCLSDYNDPGAKPYWVCRPDAEAKIRYARAGVASKEVTPSRTVFDILKTAAEKQPDKPALKVERPCPPLDAEGKPPPALPEAEWLTWTFKQYYDEAEAAAKAFIKLGLQQHDAVNIWGFNAPEWVIAAHATIMAGGKTAGLYPTDTDDTAAYKVVHSGGSIVVVEDKGKIAKLQKGLQQRGDCRRVKAIIAYGFEPSPGEQVAIHHVGNVPLLSWRQLIEMGKAEPAAKLQQIQAQVRPGHCSCLIYTSGTTGEPKAVMISHDNIVFESSSVMAMLKEVTGFGAFPEQERCLSYLPLSHVAGMMIDIVCPVITTAFSDSWTTLYFARNYDLKVGAIKDRLNVARPTFFLGVPLVWEKIADKIRAIGAANTGAKKALGDWSKGLALENSRSKQLGMGLSEPVGLTIALGILGKVKAGLGLDACKYGMTGAAPIRVDTLEYFGSLGLMINEVYGMSECTGACTLSTPEVHQWGSCGFELSGVEVKSFQCDDANFSKKSECPRSKGLDEQAESYQGELCYRGRNIMMGYMAQPDLGPAHVAEIEKKNRETIDEDGWLHSGDKGMVTQLGMCKITGRYKELIIGEGGENIAPVPIEDHVKRMCDGIAEIMMVGDKRKYNVAVVTLKAVGANGEVPGTDELDAGAARLNPAVKTISGAMKDEAWIKAITDAITSANNNGKVCFNNACKIQKFTILPHNFSEQNGELTPTKKLKRAMVQKMYNNCIEKMYSSSGTYIEYTP